MWLKGKCVEFSRGGNEWEKQKHYISVGWGEHRENVTVPKWDCTKDISKVFCPPKEELEVVDRRKCTPPLSIRAMLCIKLMVNIHCNNWTPRGVHLPQMSSQNSYYRYSEICDLFFNSGFSMHVHVSVVFFPVYGTSCCFFVYSSLSVLLKFDLTRSLFSLSCYLYAFLLHWTQWKAIVDSKGSQSKERAGREQDSNSHVVRETSERQ